MEEILHHLGSINLVNNGISYLSTGAGFQPSTTLISHMITKFDLYYVHHVRKARNALALGEVITHHMTKLQLCFKCFILGNVDGSEIIPPTIHGTGIYTYMNGRCLW